MSGATKIKELRKRMKAFEDLDPSKVNETNKEVQDRFKIHASAILGISTRLHKIEKVIQSIEMLAKKNEYRTMAMMNVLDRKLREGFPHEWNFYSDVLDESEKIQIEDFNELSALEDKEQNLVPCNDEVIADGMHVVSSFRVFKDGKELEEERVIRSKIEIGKVELWPELDEALKGMRVGETKEFPLSLQGKTDTAIVNIISISKKSDA